MKGYTSDDGATDRMARVVNRIVAPAFHDAYRPIVKRAVRGAIAETFTDAAAVQACYNARGNVESASKIMATLFKRVEYRLKASGMCPLDEIEFAFSMLRRSIAGKDPGKLDRVFNQ